MDGFHFLLYQIQNVNGVFRRVPVEILGIKYRVSRILEFLCCEGECSDAQRKY